jgi:hypothetical protein
VLLFDLAETVLPGMSSRNWETVKIPTSALLPFFGMKFTVRPEGVGGKGRSWRPGPWVRPPPS